MANRARLSETTNRKRSKQEQAARIAEEEAWRIGKLEDYEPTTLDEYGMTAYERIVRAIPESKLAEVDGYTIERAADNLADVHRIKDEIIALGFSAAFDSGLYQEKRRAEEQARKWMIELGVTPSARSKIAMDAAAAIAKPKTTRAALLEIDE